VALVAQMHTPDGGSLAVTLIALVAMIIPWFVLAYVGWIFWKAKKRDEAAERRRREWPSAHSS
jgi:hypothetical protein